MSHMRHPIGAQADISSSGSHNPNGSLRPSQKTRNRHSEPRGEINATGQSDDRGR